MARRALSLGSLLVVALLACKGVGGKGRTGTGASASHSAAPAAPIGSVPLPATPNGILPPGAADRVLKGNQRALVYLIDPGAPPRAPLRYQLVTGSHYPMEFVLELGTVAGMAMPKLTVLYDYAVAAPDPQGAWPVTATVRQWRADGGRGPFVGLFRTQLGPALNGLKYAFKMDNRGHVSDFNYTLSSGNPSVRDLLSRMRNTMDSATALMPEEAVGVGAKWQYLARGSDAGIELLHQSIFTLLERRPTGPVFDLQIRQLAASPGMRGADGKTMIELASFQSEGTMRVIADDRAPCPHSGQLSLLNVVGLKGAAAVGPIRTPVTVTFGRER